MRANAAIKKLFCKNMQDRIRYMYERLPEKIARSVNQYPARALPWLPSLSRRHSAAQACATWRVSQRLQISPFEIRKPCIGAGSELSRSTSHLSHS